MALVIKQIDLGGVNCYLGEEEGQYVLFDTGGYMVLDKTFDNRRGLLKRVLYASGCNEENLRLLVLTHGDIDHVANAQYLREQYGLKIAMHEGDLKLVQNPTIEDMMESFNYRSIAFKVIMRCMKTKIRKVMQKTLDAFETFTPDILLREGDTLQTYGFDAKILSLPGHTEGSIGILTSNNELIAGDLFQNNKHLEVAMNAIDFEGLDKSAKRIEDMKVKAIYVGHGTPWLREE